MGGSKKRLTINRTILRILKRGLRAAKLENCAVEPEHQEAMRIYLRTWCIGPLEDAIAAIDGDKSTAQVAFWAEER